MRITLLRCYPVRSSGFYRSFRFVLFLVRAGDSHLEDKVPREFSGLSRSGKRPAERDTVWVKDAQPINIYQD